MCFPGPRADEEAAGSGPVTQDEAPGPELDSLRTEKTTSSLPFLLFINRQLCVFRVLWTLMTFKNTEGDFLTQRSVCCPRGQQRSARRSVLKEEAAMLSRGRRCPQSRPGHRGCVYHHLYQGARALGLQGLHCFSPRTAGRRKDFWERKF